MDLTNYKTLKAAGAVGIQKIGDAFVLIKKRWNPDTGKIESPTFEAFDRKQIEDKKTELQLQIETLDSILTEIGALK